MKSLRGKDHRGLLKRQKIQILKKKPISKEAEKNANIQICIYRYFICKNSYYVQDYM